MSEWGISCLSTWVPGQVGRIAVEIAVGLASMHVVVGAVVGSPGAHRADEVDSHRGTHRDSAAVAARSTVAGLERSSREPGLMFRCLHPSWNWQRRSPSCWWRNKRDGSPAFRSPLCLWPANLHVWTLN